MSTSSPNKPTYGYLLHTLHYGPRKAVSDGFCCLDKEVVERGNALTAFRIVHQDDMPDFYDQVYQLPRPEGYYWAEFRAARARIEKAQGDLPKAL